MYDIESKTAEMPTFNYRNEPISKRDGKSMNNSDPVSLPYSPLRRRFLFETDKQNFELEKVKYLVVAVKLPTGAIELITNTDQIESKVEYYKNAYDDNFCLKTNPAIQIVGYMLV